MMAKLRILVDYLTGHPIRILMYHNILDDTLDPWAVSPKVFAAQMEWLAKNGYIVISLNQALSNFNSGKVPRKSIVLTFDDGFADFLENAIPVLWKYQYPATLFIVSGEVGGISRWRLPDLQIPLLNWEEIREIAKIGYDIGSHGMNHCDLTSLCAGELNTEVEDSKRLIEGRLGVKVSAFSYPWGKCTKREVDAVKKAGYCCAVTVGSDWENGPETDHFRLQRKTMCQSDSISDFINKVSGNNHFYQSLKHILIGK